jgi:hypothetical protein
MQTTVKHTKGFVAYVAIGERAVEIRAFPWSFQTHTKRTEFGRRKPKAPQAFSTLPPVLPPEPVLPGFKEPEHPPQSNTALG